MTFPPYRVPSVNSLATLSTASCSARWIPELRAERCPATINGWDSRGAGLRLPIAPGTRCAPAYSALGLDGRRPGGPTGFPLRGSP